MRCPVSILRFRRAVALPARVYLFEQFADGRVELAIFASATLADRTRDRYVDPPRIQLHHHSGAVLNLLPRQAEVRSVNQRRSPSVYDPSGGRLAHDLSEPQRAITFGEVLRVGERVLICDQNRRAFERAL